MPSIKLPVRKMSIGSIADFEDILNIPQKFDYHVVERTYKEIEQLVEKIYEKLQDELQEGNEPTFLAINKTDYLFLNAYYCYFNDNQFHGHVNIDRTGIHRKVQSIFGLKIIITTSDLFRIGWEP